MANVNLKMIYVTDLTHRLNITRYIFVNQASRLIHDIWEMFQGVVYIYSTFPCGYFRKKKGNLTLYSELHDMFFGNKIVADIIARDS